MLWLLKVNKGWWYKTKKGIFNKWYRYGYEVKLENFMKYYWDNECSKVTISSASNFESACISPTK